MTRNMKDSGIEWIGQIPEDWKIARMEWGLEEIVRRNNPIRVENILSLTKDRGVIPYEDKGNQGNKSKTNLADYKIAYENTIVMNSMNVIIGSVGLSNYRGCVSPVYYVFKAKKNNDIRFFNYICQLPVFQSELKKYANGILEIRLRVSSYNVLKRSIPFPSYYEQKKISDKLDIEVIYIDGIKSKINQQIQTLEDYKKSVITEAVTKGLDKNVEMKDSGIEWVDAIPKHWDIIKGKYILKLLKKPVKASDEVITCFRDGEVTLRSKRREEGFTFADKEIGYQGIDVGDLVVHGMDGFAGAIGISDSRGKGSPVLNVLDSICDKTYLMFYLRAMSYSDVFTALATGIRVRSVDLRWNKLANLPYPLPSKDEQNKISMFIENELYKTDSLISAKQKQLETLEEYKKSLIYEYVTGKKEVEDVGTI